MLSEIRIESLGAISTATAEFDRGLTVLTGETGTGKTMVVTGLHLLGGARADATRVRSGAERAVVEGRFTTSELGEDVTVQIDEILDSSGAERDDDGSVIAARSVSRDGPSRAYLGGRSVPAKSLGTFTSELLTLHGQNDQLRLMRPDEQRAAVDRFVDVEKSLKRYRKLREDWLAARRDLVDRTQRARELAQEADRLKFGLNEIDAVAPQPGEDDSLVEDIRRLSELDAVREAAQTARAALSGADDDPSPGTASAIDGVGQAKSAMEATDDSALRALAAQLDGALVGDRRCGKRTRRLSGRAAQRCQHPRIEAVPAGRAAHADAQVRRRHRRRPAVGHAIAGSAGAARRVRGGARRSGTPGRRTPQRRRRCGATNSPRRAPGRPRACRRR